MYTRRWIIGNEGGKAGVHRLLKEKGSEKVVDKTLCRYSFDVFTGARREAKGELVDCLSLERGESRAGHVYRRVASNTVAP